MSAISWRDAPAARSATMAASRSRFHHRRLTPHLSPPLLPLVACLSIPVGNPGGGGVCHRGRPDVFQAVRKVPAGAQAGGSITVIDPRVSRWRRCRLGVLEPQAGALEPERGRNRWGVACPVIVAAYSNLATPCADVVGQRVNVLRRVHRVEDAGRLTGDPCTPLS